MKSVGYVQKVSFKTAIIFSAKNIRVRSQNQYFFISCYQISTRRDSQIRSLLYLMVQNTFKEDRRHVEQQALNKLSA